MVSSSTQPACVLFWCVCRPSPHPSLSCLPREEPSRCARPRRGQGRRARPPRARGKRRRPRRLTGTGASASSAGSRCNGWTTSWKRPSPSTAEATSPPCRCGPAESCRCVREPRHAVDAPPPHPPRTHTLLGVPGGIIYLTIYPSLLFGVGGGSVSVWRCPSGPGCGDRRGGQAGGQCVSSSECAYQGFLKVIMVGLRLPRELKGQRLQGRICRWISHRAYFSGRAAPLWRGCLRRSGWGLLRLLVYVG